MIQSTLPSRSATTWAAVVGLTAPDLLAEGAARGTPAAPMSARAVGCEGERSATVSRPARARRLMEQAEAAGRTRVRGPGQNAWASLSASGPRIACSLAVSMSRTCEMSGLIAGRALAA